MHVKLKDPNTGVLKDVKYGFSWTTLFFGFFPALIRGDWKWAFIQFILQILSINIANIIFAFTYNGIYIRNQLLNGFIPADTISREVLVKKGYLP
jgi:hypothetical protein